MNRKPLIAVLTFAIMAALAVPAAASDLWFHVTINESGGDDANITVNLPISVVQAALPMIPDEEMRNGKIVIDDTEWDATKLRTMWNELQNTPDATFVTVESQDETIRVFKDGNYLVARTMDRSSNGAEINARLPLSVVDALLSGNGNELNVGAALQALVEHGEGELVTITDDDASIRVWIDDRPEG